MRLWLRDLLDRVDALSLRERVLVLLALIAAIGILWDALLMRPLERSRARLEPEVAGLRAELDRLNASIELLAQQASADPNREVQGQVAQAQTGIADLDRQLGGLTRGLIKPEEMVEVLRQVLASTAPLQLERLNTLPAEPLSALVQGEVLPSRMYRHGVQFELVGSYAEVLAFLRALEKLPWRFYWQDLELAVEEHPRLRVKLSAYTLGEEEAWIGA